MKDLLYKEFKLAKHPTLFIFPFLGSMLLIPGYPYMVAYIYTCLSVFFIFLNGRENKDILFTVSLPVRKRDTVKARLLMIAIIELFQILFSVPFAFLSAKINPGFSSNLAGMEANVAFFGFVFGMYGLFNIVFLPTFYQSAYKAGRSLFYGGSAITVYIFAVEGAASLVPSLRAFLDTKAPEMLVKQIPVLAAGILVYALLTFAAYRMAAKRFERVDL